MSCGKSTLSCMLFADDSQAPQELQGEAAAVVALYQRFRTRQGPTIGDVRAAARHLVDQFPAAARRNPVRENPSLGVLSPEQTRSTSAGAGSSPALLTEATGQEILRVLEAVVALLAEANGLDNPLEDED